MSAVDGLIMSALMWGSVIVSVPLGLAYARWIEVSSCKHRWLNISPEVSGGEYASLCMSCHHTSQSPKEDRA